MTEYLYRYDADAITGEPILHEFQIIKETPCGFRINGLRLGKWVSATGKKRYAYPTKDEAFESYLIRKMRYVERCRGALASAEKQYAAMKRVADEKWAESIMDCDRVLSIPVSHDNGPNEWD